MTPNRIVALFCVVFWLAVPVAAAHATPQEKVTICHAAGLEGTLHYVTLTLAYPAVYGPGGHFNESGTPQAGHEHDYLGPCQVGGGTDGGSTDGGSTDGGSTDGGSTDGGTDGGATDGGTDGGGGTTDGGGSGGGTTGSPSPDPSGGTTGGAHVPVGHELPHTGLPIWIPILIAAALLLSGGILMRSKGLDS